MKLRGPHQVIRMGSMLLDGKHINKISGESMRPRLRVNKKTQSPENFTRTLLDCHKCIASWSKEDSSMSKNPIA
ncbi:MAG: hypothetical protein WDM80_09715 [Limisphaerales bacterium]